MVHYIASLKFDISPWHIAVVVDEKLKILTSAKIFSVRCHKQLKLHFVGVISYLVKLVQLIFI